MKKSALLFSLIFFAALFLSSCAHRNITIEKRHYGNGYYVHTTGKIHHDKTVKSEDAVALQENQAMEEKAGVSISKNEEVAKVTTPAGSSEKKNGKTKHATAKEVVAEPIRAIEKNTAASAPLEPVQQVGKKKSTPSAADDVDMVLIVILCFLLPPLAVYLSEGLTTNFWIDVILTILFFLPGIIFALIVCLT